MTITANSYLYRFRLLAMRHGLDLILRQIQIQRFKSGYIRKIRDRIGLYTFQDAKVVTVYFPQRVYTYRGPDAGEMFLKDILQEERVIKDWLETNKQEAESTTDQEEDEFEQGKNCYVCGEKFIKRYASSSISDHLEKIKNLLKENELCTEKIPSIKMVKKQKRIVSTFLLFV